MTTVKLTKKAISKNANLTLNKDENVYVLTTSDRKTKEYKTVLGAVKASREAVIDLQVPTIVMANCYNWTSGGSASQRRYNESKRETEILDFLSEFSWLKGIEISWEYRESCSNVYKSFSIWADGKKSNMVGLKKELAKFSINLVW